jgi:hypothetical protein
VDDVPGPGEVDVDHEVPVPLVDGLARARALDPRGGHDDAGRSQLNVDARHELTDGVAIDHIDIGTQRAAVAGAGDIATRHCESVACQSLHDRSAKTAAGARDERHWLAHMPSCWPAATLTDGDSPGEIDRRRKLDQLAECAVWPGVMSPHS